VSDITNPFYPQLAKSVEERARKDDYIVVICNTEDRPVETRRHLERLLQHGLEGVIHASVGRDESAVLAMIPDPRRALFTNRRPLSSSANFVVSDNEGGAYSLTRHLLFQGHIRIGFIAGPSYARNAVERLSGFRRAVKEAGALPMVVKGDFSAESGRHAVRDLIKAANPPTAIIAVNDAIAVGTLEALMELGLRVPDDMSLAGFDGVHLAQSPLLHLTTVDQHIHNMGQRAVEVLLQQLAGSPDGSPVQEVLPTQLLLRRSTEGGQSTGTRSPSSPFSTTSVPSPTAKSGRPRRPVSGPRRVQARPQTP